MPKLLLATGNPGKVDEYLLLLRDLPYELATLVGEGIDAVVSEEGATMEENARTKAIAYARISGLLTMADASGLEVDALGGEPGPLSRRYAGDNVSDRERIEYLLEKLNGVPWERRSARFRCVIALASPQGQVELYQGECQGVMGVEPRGEGGFGYDPIFYLPQWDKTMAELPLEVKNEVSHRGQAARELLKRSREGIRL
jgi:XTP/dITP diphosphohydrolase